jgi:hypothetical protein
MAEIRLPVASLAPEQTMVTWGDSFAVTLVARDFGLHYEPGPDHGKLFRVCDIPALVNEYGLDVAAEGDY